MRELLKVLTAGTLLLAALAADPGLLARNTGLELADASGQTPSGSSTKPATPPASADAPGTPLHDCRLGCANQCKAFANAGLAQQCRKSCEAKCEATYGK